MSFNKKFFTTGGIVASSAAAGGGGADNFSPVIYTGNGSTQSISSLDFQPDLVWIKNRIDSTNHVLHDSVRGTSSILYSDLTNAADVGSNFQSFDTNGFTVGGSNYYNGLNDGMVAWCWKAAGAYVTDTSGDLDADISANTEAGFSIVRPAVQTGANQSIPHGLDAAPELIIQKTTAAAQNWVVYAPTIFPPSTRKIMYLNTTAAATTGGAGAGTGYSINSVTDTFIYTPGLAGVSNYDYWFGKANIMYCFHSVDGYQRIGSYTGSGISGKRVYTTDDGTSTGNGGFRPRWVMTKATTGLSYQRWYIQDSTRGGGQVLYADESFAEGSFTSMSFNDDGFTLNTTDGGINAASTTFIYLAIA